MFDRRVIDGAVVGHRIRVGAPGCGLRKVQTGFVRQYALGIVLGVGACCSLHAREGATDDGAQDTERTTAVPVPDGPGATPARAPGCDCIRAAVARRRARQTARVEWSIGAAAMIATLALAITIAVRFHTR